MNPFFICILAAFTFALQLESAESGRAATSPGDRMIAEYFQIETERIARASLADIRTADDWNGRKETYRQQLFEMLSLSPLPDRTDLQATVTGKVDHPLFTVEKLHFQSMPNLYVTANLYVPKNIQKPLPAILYVCGHARVVKDGVCFGNKTAYQHHGAWFARNGYVCLTIDTVQLGEIEGLHHGTYREGMWWWNSRGYTSAGVEAWNCIRALDYLQTRPEVDSDRLGVTGRSGGGAYSWWIVALDDRIKAAAPVAGITDLQNHVVDGTVEGHCDCMFIVNTYRWDYAQVAALAAPRPLLIANSDKDSIFPLEGVVRVHQQVRRIYNLLDAGNQLGLLITEGPHKDTQDLQVPVFRWFNRFLKNEDSLIEMAATKLFQPEQLKVFRELPADERTSRIHESFVPTAPKPSVPHSTSAWNELRNTWRHHLTQQVFAGWPSAVPALDVQQQSATERGEVRDELHVFNSQEAIRLPLRIIRPAGKIDRVLLHVVDQSGWDRWAKQVDPNELERGVVHVVFPPRGIGPTEWNQNERKQIQIRRRFMLLGQTLDSMRVWDIRRAMQALRQLDATAGLPLSLASNGGMAVNALYASLFEPDIAGLDLTALPASHEQGPDYLNVLRFLDVPQALAMSVERTPVTLRGADQSGWDYPAQVAAALGWKEGQLTFKAAPR